MRRSKAFSAIITLALLSTLVFGIPAGAQDEAHEAGGGLAERSIISADLLELETVFEDAGGGAFVAPNDLMPISPDNMVTIDASSDGDPDQLLRELEALGLTDGAIAGNLVGGSLPIDKIGDLELIKGLRSVLPAYAMSNVGLTTAQSDVAMEANLARTTYGVDGSGITIGTLSDSYNCLGGAAGDVASGDLPSGINVLDNGPCPGSDEGRAMMQIIHDSAPGSSQQFHSAFVGGQAGFAAGIAELASNGSDIINDDIFYFAEPFFQDGVIAQAVDAVAGMGIPYFSSAGNSARDSYEAPFRPSGVGGLFGERHDFNPGAGVDTTQRITVPPGATLSLSFQWDQPFNSVSGPPGSANDLDIFLFTPGGTLVSQSSFNNLAGDPVEVIVYTNTSGSANLDLVIEKFSGASPGLMKYIGFRNIDITEWDTNSGTTVGHSAAVGATAVGAAPFFNTPPFGVNPPLLEPFSSAGGTPILFTTTGAPTNVVRNKPEIVAPDAVNTTFFGGDIPQDADTFPNFFGTSAAAPAAAAGAALIQEGSPGISLTALNTALRTTTTDMLTPGFDFDSGAGLISIADAIASVSSPNCNGVPATVQIGLGQLPTPGPDVILGTNGPDTINGLGGDDLICGLGGIDIINGGNGQDTIFGGLGNDIIGGQGQADMLYGEGGVDRLNGGPGNDLLFGGPGNDDLRGQGNDDILRGEDGIDQFYGGSGNDTIYTGLGGNLGTAAVVRGQGNNDTIFGGAGADNLDGGPGLDTIHGAGGNDLLSGGNGFDRLNGDTGGDTLIGGASRDILYGGGANDDLSGGGGNDDLFGESGLDDLDGGPDTDLCDGGGGAGDTATAGCETQIGIP